MEKAGLLFNFGGSMIGNSRVKLTNVKDCVKRELVKEGQDPLHVAAEQLTKDKIDILHTIGGDDTNTTAADLAALTDTPPNNLLPSAAAVGVTSPVTFEVPGPLQGQPQLFIQVAN